MLTLNKKYNNKLSKLKFVDLFAGIGGFRLALESFGSKCVFSSEIDKNSQLVYKQNFNHLPHGDITKINESEIPEHDILCGGFPCQAFSISGKQKGFEDTRGTLFFDVVRIAKYHKPKMILLENVKNFAKHDNGKTLKVVINSLNKIGYDVFYDVLDASNFGVPQSRKRIYIIAFKKSLKISKFNFPQTNNIKTKLFDFLEEINEERIQEYEIVRSDISYKFPENIFLDSDGNYPQKPIRIGTINKGGQGERIYHPFGHAITLSAYGGGIAGKTGCYLINGINRRLTQKEVLRISGYPENFIYHPSKTQTYKQFGNTVVVNVLQEIIKSVINLKSLKLMS